MPRVFSDTRAQYGFSLVLLKSVMVASLRYMRFSDINMVFRSSKSIIIELRLFAIEHAFTPSIIPKRFSLLIGGCGTLLFDNSFFTSIILSVVMLLLTKIVRFTVKTSL